MRKIQLFVTIFLLHVAPFRLNALDNKEAINSVVKVKATPSTSIYGELVEKNGLGCIIDKSQGFLLITKELANHLSICKYEITFQNGTKVEARLKYFDPWVNFAVLQVNAGDIPKEYKAAVFTNKKFKGNEIVYAASMQGDSITMVEGFLLEKYSVYESPMPQQCYQAQLKSNGIFLSAPIFDVAGCLVSISQKSDSGRLMFLDPEYLRELVGDNKFSTRRVRKNIGAICELYPLADALEFRKVPKDFFDRYQKKSPQFRGNILAIKATIKGTPAEGVLKAGDIVVAVDGVALGPCLQVLDSAVDKSRNDFVTVEVFRNGELKKIKVETYDMEQYRIKRFIDFSSTIFFQSDELYSLRTGIPIGELTFYRYRNSTTFDKLKAAQFGDSRLFVIRGLEFDNEPISNLNVFAKKAPELIKKKNFTIKYLYLIPEINYLSEFYDGTYCDEKIISFVSIDENAKDCFEYNFDPSTNTWKKYAL